MGTGLALELAILNARVGNIRIAVKSNEYWKVRYLLFWRPSLAGNAAVGNFEENYFDHYDMADACAPGRERIAELLLRHGAPLESAFYGAARRGNAALLNFLLEKKSIPQAARNDALVFAATMGDAALADVLLNHGADANAKSRGDNEPVLFVALMPRPEKLRVWHDEPEAFAAVARLLIERGADITALSSDGDTVLHLAGCNPAAVEMLIERGVGVSAQNKAGETPLHSAARSYSPWGEAQCAESCAIVLNHGADIEAKDHKGRTPLFVAVADPYYGDMPVVRLLLERGANVRAQANGQTVLHAAACKWLSEGLCKLLIEHGALVNALDDEGRTPLHLAALHDAQEATKELIAAGADVNARDLKGRTPLHYAMDMDPQCSPWNEVQLLFDKGADVNAQDSDGRTPFHYASRRRDEILMRVMVQSMGAKRDMKDATGKTPEEFGGKTLEQLEDERAKQTTRRD